MGIQDTADQELLHLAPWLLPPQDSLQMNGRVASGKQPPKAWQHIYASHRQGAKQINGYMSSIECIHAILCCVCKPDQEEESTLRQQ